MNYMAIPGIQCEITTDIIINVVCDHFQISKEELFSQSRKRKVVEPRQIAMYLAKKYETEERLYLIAEKIGNKDHATVLYSYCTVKDRIKVDWQFRNKVESIEKDLKVN